MEGELIGRGDAFMADAAGVQIVRWSLDHALMGFRFCDAVGVALMAEGTSVLEVGVGLDCFLIDDIPHVVIRPDRGRCARSPLSFAGTRHGRRNQGLHDIGVAVAVDAARLAGYCGDRTEQSQQGERRQEFYFHPRISPHYKAVQRDAAQIGRAHV